MTAISQRKEFKRCFAKYPVRMRERRYLNPWNSKENHFRFHPSFVRKFPLKLLNYAVSSSQSSDFRARLLLNFFTRWVKKFCSPLNVKFEFSECDKLLFGGCKWDLSTKQCKMSMWFYDEFHGFRIISYRVFLFNKTMTQLRATAFTFLPRDWRPCYTNSRWW